jgi:Trk K+ transport system NAD-binding subunit
MRVLVVGAGRVASKVLLQLKKNSSITVVTVDPRARPPAVEEGIIMDVDYRSELKLGELSDLIRNENPDIVLVTTSAEDISRTGVSGLDILVEALRSELEASANVPIIAVSRDVS